jgi:hypothetical protein
MSTDAAAVPHVRIDRADAGARRAALRLAVGVTACFALVEAFEWDATFLAPLLAANMLIKLPRPPSLAQGLGIILLIALSTGVVLALTAAFIRMPSVLILVLGLLIYLSSYAHRRGAPDLATLLLQISAVSLPVIAVLSPDKAGAFAATLGLAGIVALLTVWAAHAAFPDPAGYDAPANSSAIALGPAGPQAAARNALLDTFVLLPVLIWFVLDATEVAVVVLIVIVTLLRQYDIARGGRAALGLIGGNLLGGIAAAIAYNLILLNNTLVFFIAVCLAASLMFAGRIAIADDRAPI